MSVKKLTDGKWQVRWRDINGKQRALRFNTKAEATSHEAAMRVLAGTVSEHVTATPAGSLAELSTQWLEASINLAPSTVDTYRRDLNRYILPAMGSVDPKRLSAQMIQSWIATELDRLAPSSVHRHYRTLRTMFGWAIRQGQLSVNPCDRVQPPRVPAKPPAFLTGEQVELLADEMPERYRALVLVAAFGGLRWGEAVGLRRCDVDGARITITGQLHKVDGRWMREVPKTVAGRRMVVLPATVGDELAAHMDTFCAPSPDALVFTNERNSPVGKSFRHNIWLPALARAGLISVTRRSGRVSAYGKGPTFHDLRHTAVALAIQAGAHPKAIQSRLGHASIAVTMNTYGHLIDDGSELAADLDRLRSAKK
jgi:integrase